MDVKVNKDTEKSEAELNISVGGDEFAPYVKEAAKRLSQTREIKGFRPGKAPLEVVTEVFGQERLLNEAIERAIPRFFVTAVLDNEIDAIARPNVVIKEVSTSKLNFTAKVYILPTVTLGDLSAIKVKKRAVVVVDEDAEKELRHLAKMRASYIEVTRAAEKGDTLRVDYKISVDGVVIEGGEAKNQPVNLGEGHFVEDFENKLVGVKAGETRDFPIKLPRRRGQQDQQASKTSEASEAQAWVKVLNVQQRVIPEINDEFAKQLGRFENLAQLKEKLHENIKSEKDRKEQDRFQGEMTDKLAEAAKFTAIPDALIDKEIDRLLEEFKSMLTWQNKTLDGYLLERNRTLAAVRDEMRPNAEKSVKIGLALRAFAEQEKIVVEDKEVEEKVQEYLSRYASVKDAQKEVDLPELKEHLMYTLRNQKALAALEKAISEAE